MITTLNSNKTPFVFQRPKFRFYWSAIGVSSGKRWLSWKQNCQKSDVDSILSKTESLSKTQPQFLSTVLSEISLPSLLFSLIGFSLIAMLACSETDSNFVLICDDWIHQLVSTHISPLLQTTLFQVWISDFFIASDLILLVIFLFIIALNDWRKGFGVLGVSLVGIVGGTGTHHFEGTLLNAIKVYFHRMRPRSGSYGYSFPSGHVLATIFLTRLVLYQLLPIVLDQKRGNWRSLKIVYWLDDNKDSLVTASFFMTMIGRVGADVHWFSDTLGSLCLGTAISLLLNVPFHYIKHIEQQTMEKNV